MLHIVTLVEALMQASLIKNTKIKKKSTQMVFEVLTWFSNLPTQMRENNSTIQ